MRDWLQKIDGFLQLSGREFLQDIGTISRSEAIEKAHAEFERYRTMRASQTAPIEGRFEEAIEKTRRLESGNK